MYAVLNNPMVIAVICVGAMSIGPGMLIFLLGLLRLRREERADDAAELHFQEWERQLADRDRR